MRLCVSINRRLSELVALCCMCVAACYEPNIPPAIAPATPAVMQSLPHSDHPPTVTVSSGADVAKFRLLFERDLQRAGFRVLQPGEATPDRVLAITLIGNGTGASGAAGAISYISQDNTLDATVSFDGRLVHEFHTAGKFTLVKPEQEVFTAFNTRVTAAITACFDAMAIDLTNQLVASAPSTPSAPASPVTN